MTKKNFSENCCLCKRIKPEIICNPDLIFGLREHNATMTLYTTLSLYHLEEMCHPDLTFWLSGVGGGGGGWVVGGSGDL